MISQDLICPISRDKMDTAVIAEDGFTYDKSSLDCWLSSNSISPMMGSPLPSRKTITNRSIDYLLARYEYYGKKAVHFNLIKRRETIYVAKPFPPELKTQLNALLVDYFKLIYPLTTLYKRIEDLIKKYPDVPQLYLEYANMKRFGGDLAASLELIQKAKLLNLNYAVPKYMEARVVTINGKSILGKEIIDDVLRNYPCIDHTLLEIRYLSSACLNNMAKSYAFKLITAYVLICPEDMRAFLNKIYILYMSQSNDEVLAESKKFLDKYQYDACIMYYRAKTYAKMENNEEARICLDKVLELSKEPMFLAQCHYDKAFLKPIETEFEYVREELEKAYELYPKINADIMLADIYRTQKKYIEAMNWLNIYGKRVDKSADVLYNRLNAEISEKLGLNEDAVNSYIILIEKDGIHSDYYTAKLNSLL